jgi:hypothetical protein
MTDDVQSWYAVSVILRSVHRPALIFITGMTALAATRGAFADAGPPFLTNDPGTPGNGNWEINIGSMQTLERGTGSYQLPQIDLNFGVGERIQLTYEVPYVVQVRDGAPTTTGWSNAYPGIKWRFFDEGEGGWQLSTFPQFETAGSPGAQRRSIADSGSRLLVPLELARAIGPFSVNLETGYYVQGAPERILGLVVGRTLTPRLEFDAELYNDHVLGSATESVTLDLGARYRFSRSFILLFMAGRSITGSAPGQVQFMGYLGVQILLSDYGLKLGGEP